MTDNPLVRRCMAGDVLAWQEMHQEYYQAVRAFLRRLGVCEEDVEDACQDVFVRLFRSLASFRGESELKTWIYRLCVTEAGRFRRRRRGWEAARGAVTSNPEEPSIPGPDEGDLVLRERVEVALGSMGASDRAAFVLYEFEGMSGKQIAEVLGCPVATVWRRLHYARRAFREHFELRGEG